MAHLYHPATRTHTFGGDCSSDSSEVKGGVVEGASSTTGAPKGAMLESLSVEQQLEMINRRLVDDEKQTLLTADARRHLVAILGTRPLKVYWGTATTGTPHIAYFVPISKIADFLRAGCKVKILLADLHAFLDNEKAPMELLDHRVEYYKQVITAMLEALGTPMEHLTFVKGTSFQTSPKYTLDMYRLTSKTSGRNARKAGAEVVKSAEADSAPISGLLYPLLQALDEEYLDVDAQFGGLDQRKIFVLAEDVLPKALGYKKRIHLMNPMVPGLDGGKGNKAAGGKVAPKAEAGDQTENKEDADTDTGVEKMSSSSGTKIDLLDPPDVVQTKIKGVFCAPYSDLKEDEKQDVEKKIALLAFIRMVLFSVHSEFKVERPAKYGGNVEYKDYASVEAAWKKGELFPQDLKNAVAAAISRLLAPIRAKFDNAPMQALIRAAYPEKFQGKPEKPSKSSAKTKNAVVSAPATAVTADTSVDADARGGEGAMELEKKKREKVKGGDPSRIPTDRKPKPKQQPKKAATGPPVADAVA